MNNIPYFLSHLPIWKANPKDKVKITKRAVHHVAKNSAIWKISLSTG